MRFANLSTTALRYFLPFAGGPQVATVAFLYSHVTSSVMLQPVQTECWNHLGRKGGTSTCVLHLGVHSLVDEGGVKYDDFPFLPPRSCESHSRRTMRPRWTQQFTGARSVNTNFWNDLKSPKHVGGLRIVTSWSELRFVELSADDVVVWKLARGRSC